MEHITSKNMDEYIKSAFELFVEMYGMEVPEDFCKRSNLYKWSYCSANSGKELYLKEIGREGVVCKPDAWL